MGPKRDHTRIITCSDDEFLRIWDPEASVSLMSVKMEGIVPDADWSPDDTTLAVAGDNNAVILLRDTRADLSDADLFAEALRPGRPVDR